MAGGDGEVDELGEDRLPGGVVCELRARSGSMGPCPGRYAGSDRSPSRVATSTVICTSGVRRDAVVGSAVQSLRSQVQARWSSPCMSAR